MNNFELTLPTPFISESCIRIKTNANFYFHTSLWCLKRLYEGLNFLFSSRIGTRRVNKCTKVLPQIKILQKRETSLHGLLKNLNILTVQLHLPKNLINISCGQYSSILSQTSTFIPQWYRNVTLVSNGLTLSWTNLS